MEDWPDFESEDELELEDLERDDEEEGLGGAEELEGSESDFEELSLMLELEVEGLEVELGFEVCCEGLEGTEEFVLPSTDDLIEGESFRLFSISRSIDLLLRVSTLELS